MNELARRQIASVSDLALRRADVAGIIPTPLDVVREAAGISEMIDVSELPEEIRVKRPSLMNRILGAYIFRAETAFVDLSLPDGRVRFTQGHEIGHKIIPWHEASYYIDEDTHLQPDTRDLLEQEANFAASCLIFQGVRFHERALQYELSIKTPLRLAPEFGASYHAAIRYYVEHHPDILALVLAGRYQLPGGALPVWRTIESPSFRDRYGSLSTAFPAQILSLQEQTPYAEVAKAALNAETVPQCTIALRELGGRSQSFRVEAFYNSRCLFLMLSPRRLLRTGRRLDLAHRWQETTLSQMA